MHFSPYIEYVNNMGVDLNLTIYTWVSNRHEGKEALNIGTVVYIFQENYIKTLQKY